MNNLVKTVYHYFLPSPFHLYRIVDKSYSALSLTHLPPYKPKEKKWMKLTCVHMHTYPHTLAISSLVIDLLILYFVLFLSGIFLI